MESIHRGDHYFDGNVRARTVQLPSATVGNDQVKAGAGVAASKLEHEHRVAYAQESDTTAAAETRVVHVVRGATGSIVSAAAGCVVANVGDATVSVDVTVNGSSVLTAAIEIDSADAARAVVDGAISSAALTAGDVVEIAVTVDAGTGTLGKGVFAQVNIREDAEA